MFQLNKWMALVFVFSFQILANEGGEHAAAAAPEGAATPVDKVSYEDKKQQVRTREWSDVVSGLGSLKAKIATKEDTIKEIIHHKEHAKNKAEQEVLVNELLKEHKELTKMLDEYNSNAQLLKYRYPDVGITEKRKYEKIEMKSLDDYEKSQTIEVQIKKTVSKLKSHFGVKEEKKPDAEIAKKPSFDNNYLAQPKILRK